MPVAKKDFVIVNADVEKMLLKQMEKRLTPVDLILLVLLVGSVKGRTKMQKQVFLAWKELFYDEAADPAYFPWKYGAYSRLVEQLLEVLQEKKLLRVRRRGEEGSVYSITPQGKREIEDKLSRIKIDITDLAERKANWDEWSPKGTLRYIYRNYPEYTTATKVPDVIW